MGAFSLSLTSDKNELTKFKEKKQWNFMAKSELSFVAGSFAKENLDALNRQRNLVIKPQLDEISGPAQNLLSFKSFVCFGSQLYL